MKEILLSVRPEETRLAVAENGRLIDFLTERADQQDLTGRIYKGVVKNVVPAVKGVFVDIGIGQNAFLRAEDCPKGKGRYPTEGSALLVQVIKDSTATKGPLVTGKISFSGRYAALLTDSVYIGVSRKIRSDEKREKLRRIASEKCPEGLGIIVRTAAASAPEEDVAQDIGRLADMWNVLQRRSRLEKKPALLFRGSDLSVRAVRDFLSEEIGAVVTDSSETAERLTRLIKEEGLWRPELVRCEKGPIFKNHRLEEQIEGLFQRKVPLPSGGSIVIDYTEALTAIDVNTGSFHRKGIPHNEAAFLANREAADEIARQIRMRGIGGIILIDFIDMEEKAQRDAVVAALRRATSEDRVKTVVLGMTALGLVEMTRKRTSHRLFQNYYESCPVCGGSGYVLSPSSVVLRIHYALEEKKISGGIPHPLVIECHPDVADILETQDEQWYLKSTMLRPVRVERRPDFRRDVFSILADPRGGI